MLAEQSTYYLLLKSIETRSETKLAYKTNPITNLPEQVKQGGSLNIAAQQKGVGLQFKPRDLTMAKHTLQNHGLEQRMQLNTQKMI